MRGSGGQTATRPERLQRFGRTERTLHWVHATAFVVLLGSGLCLYLPSLAEAFGRRPLLKDIHIYTALAWGCALVAVVVLGDRRALRRTAREIDELGEDSRMNRGQKINAILTAAFAVLFAVTGVLLWYGERDTRFRFENTLLVHDWLMYVSLVLFMGHLFLAVIYPRTRHSLNGITRGWVDPDWALEHHRTWAEAELEAGNVPRR